MLAIFKETSYLCNVIIREEVIADILKQRYKFI